MARRILGPREPMPNVRGRQQHKGGRSAANNNTEEVGRPTATSRRLGNCRAMGLSSMEGPRPPWGGAAKA